MAEKSYRYVLLFFLLQICCSGAVMSYSNNGRSKAATSILKALTTLRGKHVLPSQFQVVVSDYSVLDGLSNTGVIYLKQTQLGSLQSSKTMLVSGMKTHPGSHKPKLGFKSVVISSSSISDSSQENKLQVLLPILRSSSSILNALELEKPVGTSVALQLANLSLNMNQIRHLDQIVHLMRKTGSFLVMDDSVNGEWNMTEGLVQEIIDKAKLINSLLSRCDLPIILSIKSPKLPTALEVSAFRNKILSSLDDHPQISKTLAAILVQVSPIGAHRELLSSFDDKSIKHDILSPSTTSFDPTTPVTNPVTTPSGFPPYSPTPTVVTIPGTNPVSGTTTTNPISATPTDPTTIPAPAVTEPGAEPVTNPVTTYPSPSSTGGYPPTSPVTTPVTSPAVGNAPMLPGQTWCVAKSGVSEATLQAALDYACGIGGAECSMIQEGASCYDPNSLQNHASYAFNSYFQKNPAATSCDFGGAAVLVNTNPSSGSCLYPSSATAAVPSTIPPATTTSVPSTIPPATTAAPYTIPPATTSSSSGSTGIGSSYGPPPSVLNTSGDPTSGSSTGFGYGSDSPPIITAPPSVSSGLQPLFSFTTSIALLVMIRLAV